MPFNEIEEELWRTERGVRYATSEWPQKIKEIKEILNKFIWYAENESVEQTEALSPNFRMGYGDFLETGLPIVVSAPADMSTHAKRDRLLRDIFAQYDCQEELFQQSFSVPAGTEVKAIRARFDPDRIRVRVRLAQPK